MAQSTFVTNKITGLPANNEYERESSLGGQIEPFSTWLRERCARMADNNNTDVNELTALLIQPSKRVCSFKSMMSYGSHYHIEGDGVGEQHVTYDCGVAEMQALREGDNCADPVGVVHIIRVGTLKDILVLNYVNLNVVLMVEQQSIHTTFVGIADAQTCHIVFRTRHMCSYGAPPHAHRCNSGCEYACIFFLVDKGAPSHADC